MDGNPQQLAAVLERRNCVVLAGPGSGKTRTLTAAITHALLNDVKEPRGIACITYNNECALELESKLMRLGVEADGRVFVGTVHAFALTNIIFPYAKCADPSFPENIGIATLAQQAEAWEIACELMPNSKPADVKRRAKMKRVLDIDRNGEDWSKNPDLVKVIEAYEAILRQQSLIDFDDMTLITTKLVKEHAWIRDGLAAKFQVLFIDEYQDLGVALHELVLELCFKSSIRLFVVGDPDQSIYGFLGANPKLLEELSSRSDVVKIQLPFNYRCGKMIVAASSVALGEGRTYVTPADAHIGEINIHPIDGDDQTQAAFIFQQLIPALHAQGFKSEDIAVLYRGSAEGDILSAHADHADMAYARSDTNALIPRNNPLSRFIESTATWIAGGWKEGNPSFQLLVRSATRNVYKGGTCTDDERLNIERELAIFLHECLDMPHQSTHAWLNHLKNEVFDVWKSRSNSVSEDWEIITKMIDRTDPARGLDMTLAHFTGRYETVGRLNLSTLHSAKGREFGAVILYGMNELSFPKEYELEGKSAREARRLFYVGVTRAKHQLHLIVKKKHSSPWVRELYRRSQQSGFEVTVRS